MDADLPLDRRDGPRRAPRRADLLQVALRLRDRAVLVDPLDRGRLRGDQVRERGDDDARGRADLPARPDARQPARRGGRRRRLGRGPGDGVRDLDRPRRPRLSVLRALLVARRARLRSRRRLRRRRSPSSSSARGYFVRQQQFTSSCSRVRDRRRRRSGSPGRAARELRATGRAGTRSARSSLRSARCSSSTASSSSTCHEWQVTTQYYKNRMVDLGLRAGLSFAIGLGRPAGHRRPRLAPAARSGAATRPTAPSPPGRRPRSSRLALYTAVKAAYLSTIFATLWEERDLIYLSPLLLLGTAMVFESKRLDWRVVGGGNRVRARARAVQGDPARLALLRGARARRSPALLDHYRHWTTHDLRLGLLASLARLARAPDRLPAAARRRRARPSCSCSAWMLSAEIAMTVGIDQVATSFRDNLPKPLDWVDQATGGQPVDLPRPGDQGPERRVADRVLEPLDHSTSTSLDGTAPGPGPDLDPEPRSTPDGLLSGSRRRPYVLADTGVILDAPVVAQARQGAHDALPEPDRPVAPARRGPAGLLRRLVPATGAPTPTSSPDQQGTLVVSLGRHGYNGSAPPAQATSSSAPSGSTGTTHAGARSRSTARPPRRRRTAATQTVTIPVARTPVRVEITIPDTIPPDRQRPAQPRRPGRLPVRARSAVKPRAVSVRRRDGAHARGARARCAPAWDALPWEREEAAYEYFTTRLRTRPDVIGPFAAVVVSTATRRSRGSRGGSSPPPPDGARLQGRLRAARPAPPRRRRRDRRRRAARRSTRCSQARPRHALARRRRSTSSRSRRSSSAPTLFDASAASAAPSSASRSSRPWTRRRLDAARRASSESRRLAQLEHALADPPRRPAARGRRSATSSASRSCATLAGSSGSSETPTGSPARPTSARSAPGSPTRPEQRALARVGLEHGWVRGYLLYLRRRADRLLALLDLRRHDADPDGRLRRRLRRAPRRHLPPDARDRGRLRRPGAARRSTSGPATPAYKQQFSNESAQERNVVVFAPTFRARRHQRDPDARSSARARLARSAARRDRAHRPRPRRLARASRRYDRRHVKLLDRRPPRHRRCSAAPARPALRPAARRDGPHAATSTSAPSTSANRRLRGPRPSSSPASRSVPAT